MCRSKEAAAVSLPSQLMRQEEELPSASGEGQKQQGSGTENGQEGGGDTDGAGKGLRAPLTTERSAARWVWRTPLEKSRPHWEGWYRGLSDEFLKVWEDGVRGKCVGEKCGRL